MAGDIEAFLIAGPTASGKSALAVRLAQASGGMVVNADSMQVYRDLAILSARPDAAEQAGVPHHLFGFVDGAEEFTVGAWLRAVAALPPGRPHIFVGGTGLYFKALTEGLVETPPVPPEITAAIAARAAEGENLHAALARIDPGGAARLAPADSPRIQRALAVREAPGAGLAQWQAGHSQRPVLAPGSWRGVFLAPAREVLYQRIDRRFEQMIGQGALHEVAALKARGLPANRGVMKAHGVPHLIRHLAGETTVEEAIRLGQQDTRNYAKRQFTWARKFMAGWAWCADAEEAMDRLR